MFNFNPKALSDEELLAKTNDLQKKISWSQRFAGYGQGIQQMQAILTLIENERFERLFMERWNMIKPFVVEPIETDPNLRDAARAAKEKEHQPEKVRPRPRTERRPFPTATPFPVIPKNDE